MEDKEGKKARMKQWWAELKADPVRHEAYLARARERREERAKQPGYRERQRELAKRWRENNIEKCEEIRERSNAARRSRMQDGRYREELNSKRRVRDRAYRIKHPEREKERHAKDYARRDKVKAQERTRCWEKALRLNYPTEARRRARVKRSKYYHGHTRDKIIARTLVAKTMGVKYSTAPEELVLVKAAHLRLRRAIKHLLT